MSNSSFAIDLPAYTKKDELRYKLLYAIRHATLIDLDTDPFEEEEEE